MTDKLVHERQLWPIYPHIAGLDEAGRGAWAGPVVAAAVVFPIGFFIPEVDDSKKLSPKVREKLFDQIKASCVSFGIGLVESQVIDQINILEASKQAMLIAVSQLSPQPDFLLVDGNMTLNTPLKQKFLIDGDALSHSIAAASILAKVTRDHLMVDLAQSFPNYGFEKHKGYGTKFHQEALKNHGCLEIHRHSYRPIQVFSQSRE